MSLESPPRLKRGAELGPFLRAANTPVSAERIASTRAAVKAAMAAGLARASLPLWVKLAVPLLLVAGGVVLYGMLSSRGGASSPALPAEVAAPTPEVAAPTPEVAEVAAPAPEVAAPAPEMAPPTTTAAAPPPAPPRAPAMKPRTRIAEEVAPAPTPQAPPAPSDLPAQIQLYEDARAAAGRGELARGVELLDELLRRFPSTPLRAEAELTRAELLSRGDRLEDAAAALEALVASPAHQGRRGELLRALGDVRRKQGDCPRAIDAYTRARAARLSAAEHAKVDRGLERCAAPR